MKRNLITLIAPSLLLLVTACQKTAPTAAQLQAGEVVGSYAAHISAAIGTRADLVSTATSGSAYYGSTGTTDPSVLYSSLFNTSGYGGWNPFGGQPYGGSYVQPDLENQLRTCLSVVHGIQPTAENYQFMVASLARCLNTALTYRNPLMSYGYRNMGSTGQNYYNYGLDALRPGVYGAYGGGNYSMFSGYSSQGFVTAPITFNSGD
jgi:hypothetical protein